MNSKQARVKRNIFFRLFCCSFLLHLSLPFLVFIGNFSSFDKKLILASYLSPLWIIILIWLLLLILITANYSFLSEFKNYLKKKITLLQLTFILIFAFGWYLLPGVHNVINTFVLNLNIEGFQKGQGLINYLSTQLPKIVSILLWELMIFWLLSMLIYLVDKRPKNVLKKREYTLSEQHSISQKLWSVPRSIFILPFKDLGTHSKAIISILAVFSVILAFVLSSPYFPGADTVYFAGVTAVVGLIFTWSASAAIADFISGIILIFFANLEKDDWVKIGDITGKIQEQNLLVHHLKTTKNNIVIIPNANVLRNIITNYTPSKKRTGIESPQIIYTTVTLGYDVDQKKAINVLELSAKLTSGIITQKKAAEMQQEFISLSKQDSHKRILSRESANEIEKLYQKIIKGKILVEPFVLITSLDDFYVSYELNAYLNPLVSLLEPEMIPKIYSELHQNIHQVSIHQEIEILSPHYEAQRDGNQGFANKLILREFPAPEKPPQMNN